MRNIAVFFGGKSNEREISVITGMLAVNLLRGERLRVLPVYIDGTGECFVCEEARGVEFFRNPDKKKLISVAVDDGALVRRKGRRKTVAKIDCALNCCHGGMGEDGTLSALLKWHKIPLASPDTPVSAVFMNKKYSKLAARGLEIPVVPAFSVSEGEWKEGRERVLARADGFGYPLVVKPNELGSSIGISVVKDGAELISALNFAFQLDKGAILERYLVGKRDLNCAAARRAEGVQVSPVEEVFSGREILTFSEKYREGERGKTSKLPADLPQERMDEVQEYTRRIYEAFDCRGVVRADFLLADGRVYFNELNTVPGSLACYLFGETLTDARKLLLDLIEERLANPEKENMLITTGILNDGVFGGAKGCKSRRNLV